MDRRDASIILGVAEDVDLATLKRRFRTLARDHHPDRGGDPDRFLELRRAFALLRDELDTDGPRRHRPLVARGRPSREAAREASSLGVDPAELDEDARRLARRLGSDGSCRYSSRAPGARTNRLATSLAAASTSGLQVALAPPSGARIVLTARSRAARRAVTALDLTRLRGASWSRRRGDAITELHATIRDPSATAVTASTAAAVTELLDALSWPLREWTVERTGHGRDA